MLTVKNLNKGACILNLDFFKAYNRVMLGFLLRVMKAMNFGEIFLSWISMLHEGARTRFILGFLTGTIDLTFSIRQGDPLAMLYIYHLCGAFVTTLREKINWLETSKS